MADTGSYPGFRRLKAEMLKQAETAVKLADLAAGLDDLVSLHWDLINHISRCSVYELIRLRRTIRKTLNEMT